MGHLRGDITLWLIAGPLLVAWFVVAVVAVSLARLLGVPEQPVLGAWAVAFFVGFWAIGLWFLFGGSSDDEHPA